MCNVFGKKKINLLNMYVKFVDFITRQVLSRTNRSGIRTVYIREPLSSLSIIDMVGLDSQYGLVKTKSSPYAKVI